MTRVLLVPSLSKQNCAKEKRMITISKYMQKVKSIGNAFQAIGETIPE